MTVDELENYVFDVIEEHYSFLETELNICRIGKKNWKIKFPYKNLVGNGKTKEEALKDLLLKITDTVLEVA